MERIIHAASYDYRARQKALQALCRQYGFLQKAVIGKSCAGREIAVYRMGTANQYSLLAAAFHGSEHITSVVLMMLMEELAHAVSLDGMAGGFNIRKKLQNRSILFVPCVNPDGCEISLYGGIAAGTWRRTIEKTGGQDLTHWNANLRGVDINHNFNAGWRELRQKECAAGIYGPGPTRFGGRSPESEPETRAIVKLCRALTICRAAALHTQGEVIYWEYGNNTPPCSLGLAQALGKVSGYHPEAPCDLATGGGFKDWFIQEFCRPGFTFELGKGQNPLPPQEAATIYQKCREMFLLFL